jgi:hypothetical protein
MSHHYSNKIVVRCSDDRYSKDREFAKGFDIFLKDNNISDYYAFFGFGASLEISKDEFASIWLDRIKTAKALNINEIIVVDHLDCGRFTLEYGEMSRDDERLKHIETLNKAKDFFQKNAPDFKYSGFIQEGEDFLKFSHVDF